MLKDILEQIEIISQTAAEIIDEKAILETILEQYSQQQKEE